MNEVYSQMANGQTGQSYINKFSGNKSEISSTERINSRGFNFYGIITSADKYQTKFYGTENRSESTAYQKTVPVIHYEVMDFSKQKKYFQNQNSTSGLNL